MDIDQAEEKWASSFAQVYDACICLSQSTNSYFKVYTYMYAGAKSSARDHCNDLLQDPDLHLFYQVKCYLMLAGLANIPPVAESHLTQADRLCTQLYEGRQEGEEEEIQAYREIINSSLEDLRVEMREWKIEEGIYVSSSEED
jgi:hypothetical protein